MPIGNPIQKNNDTRVISATATTGQTDFTVTGGYTINAIGVFRNGVRLNNSTDFTAADGSTVSLNVACDAGDTVTFHIFDKFTVANAIVGAASTQTVYGNLAVNGELYSTNLNPTNVDIAGIGTIAKAIIGTGVTIDQSNIDTVGLISATTFTGNLVGNVTGTITGAASQITVADESSDTTCFPTFVTAATGNLAPKSGTNLTFNSSSGALTATSVAGNIVGGTVSGSTGTFTGDVDIADKIVHTGDTNTAIRFPAADTVSVETAGTQRVSIASGGDINLHNRTSASSTDPVTVDFGGQYTPDASITHQNLKIKLFSNASNDDSGGLTAAQSGMAYVSPVSAGHLFYTAPSAVDTLVEKVRIQPDGKVGIGTDNPGTVAHLLSSDCYLTMQASSASGNGGILFKDSGGTQNSVILYDFDNDYLKITTNADTEALRIDSSQRLLVGTTASISNYGVQNRFQVAGTDYATSGIGIRRDSNDAGGGAIIFGKSRGSQGGNTVVQSGDSLGEFVFCGGDGTDVTSYAATINASVDGSPGSNDMPGRLVFSTTADGAAGVTERMRITSAGKVLVGGTSAVGNGTNLEVLHSSSASAARILAHGFIARDNYGVATNIGNGIYSPASDVLAFATNSTERMRINSSGVVGINTDASNAQLIVHKNNTNTSITGHNYLATQSGMMIQNRQPSAAGQFTAFTGNVSSAGGYTQSASMVVESTATAYSPKMHFTRRSGSGTQGISMTIDEASNIGIGETSPDRQLHIRGSAPIIKLDDTGGGYSEISANTAVLSLRADVGDTQSSSYIDFQVDGDACVRIHADGTMSAPYGVELGNALNNADSNTLDDYEEGTWTVGNASALGGTGRSVNTAVYTKIGNTVTIALNIFASGNDMSTGGVTLSGLPFTVKDHQGIFLGGYNNKDCSGAYINSTNIIIMSGNSGTRHLWTNFTYIIN